jgi:hypothetical protein
MEKTPANVASDKVCPIFIHRSYQASASAPQTRRTPQTCLQPREIFEVTNITVTSDITVSPASQPALPELQTPLTADEAEAFFVAHDGRWPYSENSGLIDRETAFSIRVLMLQWMSEAELNSYSQRQLMMMYVDFLGCLLEDVCREMADPDLKRWAAERAELMFGGPAKSSGEAMGAGDAR